MAEVLRIAQYYSYMLDWRFLLLTLFFVTLSMVIGVLFYALCQPFISVRRRWGSSCSFSPWDSVPAW